MPMFRKDYIRLAKRIMHGISQDEDHVAFFIRGANFPDLNNKRLDMLDTFLPKNLFCLPWTSDGNVQLVVYSTNIVNGWNAFIQGMITFLKSDGDKALANFRPTAEELRQKIQASEGVELPELPF